jgi:C-terminal processing protease CtpA/Prc
VSGVSDNGPASTALKVGDTLLRVDEIDLCNVTKDTAEKILQATNSSVSLLVSRSDAVVR